MFTDKYSDRVDATTVISLFEYGLIRNPDTDKVIFCINPSDNEHDRNNPPRITTTFITLDEVKDVLKEIDDRYFDFIGSTRLTELYNLDNNHLSHHIQSINMWDGSLFTQEHYRSY